MNDHNVSSTENVLSADTYARASAYAPGKFGGNLGGVVADGYWIDDQRYFFSVSEIDANGRLLFLPKIADAADGTVSLVISPNELINLISGHSETDPTLVDLADAQYDMPNGERLVITLGANIYHVVLAGPALVKVEAVDPLMALHSPDGTMACILKDHAIWLKDRAAGTTKQLTPNGTAYHAFGSPPESGVMPVTSRKVAMPCGLWSADSEWFVTHRIDERDLPESGLVEHVPVGGMRPVTHEFKVAGPDHELPTLEYVAIHVRTGRTISAAERPVIVQVFSPFTYRQGWFSSGSFYFLDWGRFSSVLSLAVMDLATGAIRTVLTEEVDSGWIDIHPFITGQPIVRPLPASEELIWFSQADGLGHLYLHDLATGALKNRITKGDWVVRELVHVDESARRVLFLASGFDGSVDLGWRRLCSINFDGSGLETLLENDGDWAIKPEPVSGVHQIKPFRPSYARSGVSPDGRFAVATFGAADAPTRTMLIDIVTGRQIMLAELDVQQWKAPVPRPFEALAADGVTRLFGALYLPSGFDEAKSYPIVDYIYPGPQLNWYSRSFPNIIAASLQSVVELGMVGLILETRGMPNRDRAFHQAGSGSMHEPQLSDHVAVIEQLCQRHGFLDRDRVGMFGQSGGGYATARAMFDYPETFKVGVSVCGNHDNRNYIAHWIDKYGGRPGSPERDEQSNVEVAHKLQGKLLLIHGDMDENVHPGHTIAVSAALIAAGKEFDQLIVPGADHAVMLSSAYVQQRLWNYFVRHLLRAEPPSDFILEYSAAEATAALRMMSADVG